MNWLTTTGGPFLVCPAELVSQWRGILDWFPEEDARDPGVIPSDYARACLINDCVGSIAVGEGSALVLGDDPCPTAYLAVDDGGMFIRWVWAEDQASIARALEDVPVTIWEPTRCHITVGTGGLILFDSASPGDLLRQSSEDPVEEWRPFDLASGRYDVETADFSPDPATRLLLHRLRRWEDRLKGSGVAPTPTT